MKKTRIVLFTSIVMNVCLLLLFFLLLNRLGGIRYVIWKATIGDRVTGVSAGRSEHFENIPVSPTDVVFIGDSITAQAEWAELIGDCRVRNRGIAGETTKALQKRLKILVATKPAAVFIMSGINDLVSDSPADVAMRLKAIINDIANHSPKTAIYIQSILPVNNTIRRTGIAIDDIRVTNSDLRYHCYHTKRAVFIDLWPVFADINGQLGNQFTYDGIHLNGKAYMQWRAAISPYLIKHLGSNQRLNADGLQPSASGRR